MTVLSERFAAAHSGFIPFVVAGTPNLATTGAIIRQISRFNPVAIEVGVPFSDPTADGPVIQRAAKRALENGTTLHGVLRMLGGLDQETIPPVVLFSYFNPILQFGLEKFARSLRHHGVAGVLVVDLPAEAAANLQQRLRREDIDLIMLVAPTTSDVRLEHIARLGSGFIYAVARTGVTGTASELADESRQLVRRIRKVTDVPVAVGFGITSREEARRVCRYADAAVIGSHLVAEIERAGSSRASVIRAVRCWARQFA